jgi:hypothetical protein
MAESWPTKPITWNNLDEVGQGQTYQLLGADLEREVRGVARGQQASEMFFPTPPGRRYPLETKREKAVWKAN